jgi:transcriptional regulator with XRE-family HTH domain
MAIPKSSRQIHLRLRELRLKHGMSPNDLAYKARLSGKTVRMAEAGFIPSPRTQFAIAAQFKGEDGNPLGPLDLWPLDRDRQTVAA